MNVSKFYGSSATVRVVEDGNISKDPDMSDDESFLTGNFSSNKYQVLASDSESDEDISNIYKFHRAIGLLIDVIETACKQASPILYVPQGITLCTNI